MKTELCSPKNLGMVGSNVAIINGFMQVLRAVYYDVNCS